MIKKFHKFFEALNFMDTDEHEAIKNKHRIPDEVIKDYFNDLLDEGSEIEINCNMDGIKEGIKLYYNITISKNIKNPQYKHTIPTNEYLRFIEEQSNFIKLFNISLDRLKIGEDLDIKFNTITQIPFWGAGNNTQEFGTLSQTIAFWQELKTDDYRLAKEEFNKKDNPAKKAIEDVIKRLEEMGIKESRQLIDTQENEDIIFIGFLTDDEIIVIATWSEEYGLIYEEDELANAVNAYEDGYCDEILGK